MIPGSPKRYFEPFLGSGAVFFALRPERAILSDLNSDLIATFRQVRDCPGQLVGVLSRYPYDPELYYGIRIGATSNRLEHAANFIYLNRCGWNGVYRVNRRGEFNVPLGTRTTPPVICDARAIREASAALKSARLRAADFGAVLSHAGSGDFVFADPPYTVTHGENGFVKYNDKMFSWEDQERLQEALMGVNERGGLFLLTNANHASIRRLYRGFVMRPFARLSRIAASSKARRPVTELVITNYAYDPSWTRSHALH